MGIKWENVQICVSALGNNIYLAKCSTKNPMVMNDRSDDRTNECIRAVITHMDCCSKDEDKDSISYSCEAGTLTWTRNKK